MTVPGKRYAKASLESSQYFRRSLWVGHYSPKGGITGPLGGALQGELQVGLEAERVTGPDLEALGEVRRVAEGRDHLAGHLLWFAAGRVQGEVRLVHVQGDRLDHGRQTMDDGWDRIRFGGDLGRRFVDVERRAD